MVAATPLSSATACRPRSRPSRPGASATAQVAPRCGELVRLGGPLRRRNDLRGCGSAPPHGPSGHRRQPPRRPALGFCQIAGALHDASGSYYGTHCTETPAIRATSGAWRRRGLRINAPMIGPGDYFQARSSTRRVLRRLPRAELAAASCNLERLERRLTASRRTASTRHRRPVHRNGRPADHGLERSRPTSTSGRRACGRRSTARTSRSPTTRRRRR